MTVVVGDVMKEAAEYFSLARASVHVSPNLDLMIELATLCEGLFQKGHYIRFFTEVCTYSVLLMDRFGRS